MIYFSLIWFLYLQGDRIHASIGRALVAPYEKRLKEGLWTTFENFTVVHSGGAYRTSKHTYMIQFVRRTRVCVSDFLRRPLTGFQPVAFRDILDGLVNTEYLVGQYIKTCSWCDSIRVVLILLRIDQSGPFFYRYL